MSRSEDESLLLVYRVCAFNKWERIFIIFITKFKFSSSTQITRFNLTINNISVFVYEKSVEMNLNKTQENVCGQ